jgi:hypothetical protein
MGCSPHIFVPENHTFSAFFQVVPFQSHMPTFMSWTSYHSSLENGNAKGFAKRIQSFHCGASIYEDLAIPSLQVMTGKDFIL